MPHRDASSLGVAVRRASTVRGHLPSIFRMMKRIRNIPIPPPASQVIKAAQPAAATGSIIATSSMVFSFRARAYATAVPENLFNQVIRLPQGGRALPGENQGRGDPDHRALHAVLPRARHV